MQEQRISIKSNMNLKTILIIDRFRNMQDEYYSIFVDKVTVLDRFHATYYYALSPVDLAEQITSVQPMYDPYVPNHS